MTTPTISFWERDEHGVERHVQRPMTGDELAEHRKQQKAIQAEIAEAEAAGHPLLAQIETMTADEKKKLRKLLEG